MDAKPISSPSPNISLPDADDAKTPLSPKQQKQADLDASIWSLNDVSRSLVAQAKWKGSSDEMSSSSPKSLGQQMVDAHANQFKFNPASFSDPAEYEKGDKYRFQVHMLQKDGGIAADGTIKDELFTGNRVLSTSVVTEKNGTAWANVGLVLSVAPERVLISSPADLSLNLNTRHKNVSINQAQHARYTMESPDSVTSKQVKQDMKWNEVLVRADAPSKHDKDINPVGELKATGVVFYGDKVTAEERQFAELIAKANGLPLCEL